MRRDLIIGLVVAILLHGGVARLGMLKSAIQTPNVRPKEKLIEIEMPPLEPDKPEKADPEDRPEETPEVAPPMQMDIPQLAPPSAFVQQVQPPPPDGVRPNVGAIVIPQTGIRSKTLGEIFDPRSLDEQPVARLQGKPVYPFEMLRTGNTGTVTVGFVVNGNGDVQNAYAVSSTQREFESAAILAVSKWKFHPGRRGGRAVATRMQVPIVFNISPE